MTRNSFARLAAALALLLLAVAAEAATVSGRVLDAAGAPVAGAKVAWEAYRTPEQALVDDTKGATPSALGETATDADGRFQVKLDKPGVEVSIRIVPDALPGALIGGPYDASEDAALGDVALPAAEKVSGRVTDEAGKPVSGAKVRASGSLSFEEESTVLYAEATSAADGSYSIPNAPATGFGLTVRAEGYSQSSQPSLQRRTVVNVTLKKGGTVTDAAGRPAEGAATNGSSERLLKSGNLVPDDNRPRSVGEQR